MSELMSERRVSELFSNGTVPSAPVTLLALGDCNTNGGGNGPTLVDYAAQRLLAAGTDCEVVNWGHTMTTTREGLARLQQGRLDVDAVILNYGLVDSWVTTIPMIYVPYFPETWPKRLARKFLKSIKRRLRSPWIQRWVPRGEVVSLGEYGENLRRMIALLNQRNPSVKIVLWSTANVLGQPERNVNIDRYNAQLRTIARDTNSIFIDTAHELSSLSDAAGFIDAVHLSNESYARLGIAIAEALVPYLERTAPGRSCRSAA